MKKFVDFFKEIIMFKIKYLQGREFFTCRDVLWYLVFCGFAINYMLRLNLHLTIVSMVIPPETPGNNGVTTPSNISILKYEVSIFLYFFVLTYD